MTQALATYTSLEETMSLGDLLAKSGFFPDSRSAAQAVVKVLAGREIGFGPIASMTGINVIQGKVGIGANLIAAAIKRSGKYDYRVKDMTNERCEIDFRERTGDKWEVIGNSVFTKADALAAGTKNMEKFARNMLFARAMSNGARWFTPDIFGGPIYTPEELGATVDGETGEVIDMPPARTVKIEKPSAGPSWPAGQIEVEPPARDPNGFDDLPSASAERNGNGKTRPDWHTKDEAIDWGFEQGCFDHRNHAENAFNKVLDTLKASGGKITYGMMFDAWYADVQRRVVEHNERISAELDKQAATEEKALF